MPNGFIIQCMAFIRVMFVLCPQNVYEDFEMTIEILFVLSSFYVNQKRVRKLKSTYHCAQHKNY